MGDNGKENGDSYNGLYGGCQNYGPFLGTLNIRCRIIIGTLKGAIILTIAHIWNPIKTANKDYFLSCSAVPGIPS